MGKINVDKLKSAVSNVRRRSDVTNSERILVSAYHIQELFGISPAGLHKWKKQANWPKAAFNNSLYDLKIVFTWYVSWKFGNVDMAAEMSAERLKREVAKRRKEELIADELDGQLIRRDEVLQEFTNRIMVVKAGLMHLNRILPPQLKGHDEREWGEIIRKNTNQLLARYSAGGGVLRRDGKNSGQK